jgi:hypothetical protein
MACGFATELRVDRNWRRLKKKMDNLTASLNKALAFIKDPENKSVVIASSVVLAGVLAVAFSSSSSSPKAGTTTKDATPTTTTTTTTTSTPPTPVQAVPQTPPTPPHTPHTPQMASQTPLPTLLTSSRKTPLVVSPPTPKSEIKTSGPISDELFLQFLKHSKAQMESKLCRAQIITCMTDEHLSYEQAIKKYIKNETWETLNIEPKYGKQKLLVAMKTNSEIYKGVKALKMAEKEAKPYVLLNNENVDKWNAYNQTKAAIKMQYKQEWAKEFSERNKEKLKEKVKAVATQYQTLSNKTQGMNETNKMIVRSNFTDDEIMIMAKAEVVKDYNNSKKTRNTRTPRSVLKSRNK